MNREWVDEFIRWHEQRLLECRYSVEIAAELRHARDRWLSQVK